MDLLDQEAIVLRAVRAGLAGLSDDDFRSIERLIRCFPVPRVDHAWLVMRAIDRLFREVPWVPELVALEELVGLLRRIRPRLDELQSQSGEASRLEGELRGDFLESGSLFRPKDVSGADALRVVLVAANWVWVDKKVARTTALAAFGRAIRTLDNLPTEAGRSLYGIDRAATLEGFLQATNGLHFHPSEDLREIWAGNFVPVLRELSGRASPPEAPPKPPAPQPDPPVAGPRPGGSGAKKAGSGKRRAWSGDAVVDRLVGGIRRVRSPRPAGFEVPALGESPQELDAPAHTAALLEPPANKDASAVLQRQIRQAIWNSNHLLLPEHPAVLRWDDYVRVVRRLASDLAKSGQDAAIQGVRAVLLLHALTGRTVRALQSMRVSRDREGRPDAGLPEILVHRGAIRFPCFWQLPDERGDSPEYFKPSDRQRLFLEDVRADFLAPLLPRLQLALSAHADAIATCLRWSHDELAQAMRDLAAEIEDEDGVEFTLGQLRASFSVHLFEQCRDVATTQLVTADTLGQSTAPLAYYAPRARDLAECFWTFQCRALGDEVSMPAYPLGEERIGSHLLVTLESAKRLANATPSVIRHGVDRLLSEGRLSDLHDAITTHTICMLLAVATHRPAESLFRLTLGDLLIERDSGAALFSDKVHDGAHNPRLVALPKTVVRQLHAYLTHLSGLYVREPLLSGHVRRVLAGEAPLFFKLVPDVGCAELNLESFKAGLPERWRELPLNWGRHWMRTRAIEAGIRPELVNMQLGHLEAVGYPFSGASPTEPWRFVQAVAGDWERLSQLQGWEVFHGLKGPFTEGAWLPPLQSWSTHVHAHMALMRETAAAWNAKLKSELRSFRQDALSRVLEHPDLIAAGITARFSAGPGNCDRHDLTQADFERIRDELFEAAGDDLARALALANAVCRVARVVNRRSRQPGETPGPIRTLRRPLDNAFVPKMMTAVRQVDALRKHVATLVSVKAVDRVWDLEIACAHAVLALCLFGYCESFDQVLGVLRHRADRIRSRVLPDLVLVPFGPADHEVLGLRGVAAIVIAKLARNFPGSETPSIEAIEAAIAKLLPDWAVASQGGRKSGGWAARLFETCAMANRYELSPAARMANALAGGSTPAHIQEQAALVDGDPAGALRRSWEVKDDAAQMATPPSVVSGRTANARSQYSALCAVFPDKGDTYLPTTGRWIRSNVTASDESRRLIIEELRARLAESRPEAALQPIVHVLTEWVVDMLVNGTPMKPNPALSTVETYLTRIGGVLTHVFGQSSLEFVDDAELEEAYLSAIEAKDKEKNNSSSQKAATSIHFHAFAIAHAGFPDIDLSQIRLYLRMMKEPLADARLVLPSERQAAMEKIEGLASTPVRSSALESRVHRQSVFAMGLYALRGLRRSEPIGMHFRDVTVNGSDVVVRIRSNQTRRVKTQNARRVIRLPLDAVRVRDVHLGQWVETERDRLGGRRLERALVFGSAEAPFSAEQGVKVAAVCLEALRESTGRPRQRLHALRHLVGIEQVTPVFLTPADRSALCESLSCPGVPTMASDLALPRDLQAQIIPLGHGNPKTTIQHYHHLPWLLRSRSDERLSSQYVNRATLAPLLGVTLHAMDFAVKKHPDRPRGLVWLDIAAKVRPRPLVGRGRENRPALGAPGGNEVAAPHAWTASELSKVLDEVVRVGDLEKVLLARGAPVSQAAALRRALAPMERRLGRRLLVEDTASIKAGVPRRVLRPIRSARGLNVLLDWFDRDVDGRSALLISLADDLFEHLHPKQGDRIVLSQSCGPKLELLLVHAGVPKTALISEIDELGMYALRVQRPRQGHKSEVPPQGDQYLGLVLKRLLLVIRVAAKTSSDASR